MSALIGHAKAARILADELNAVAVNLTEQALPQAALIVSALALANSRAAIRMDQAMREEASGYQESEVDQP